MAKLKPLDEWGVNNEILTPALFQRFLRVVQGLEGTFSAFFVRSSISRSAASGAVSLKTRA
jgi:hypothetical protein